MTEVIYFARQHQHPLQCTMEATDGCGAATLSRNLDKTLRRAVALANARQHADANRETC